MADISPMARNYLRFITSNVNCDRDLLIAFGVRKNKTCHGGANNVICLDYHVLITIILNNN